MWHILIEIKWFWYNSREKISLFFVLKSEFYWKVNNFGIELMELIEFLEYFCHLMTWNINGNFFFVFMNKIRMNNKHSFYFFLYWSKGFLIIFFNKRKKVLMFKTKCFACCSSKEFFCSHLSAKLTLLKSHRRLFFLFAYLPQPLICLRPIWISWRPHKME